MKTQFGKNPVQPNNLKSKVIQAILELTEDQCIFLMEQAEKQKLPQGERML